MSLSVFFVCLSIGLHAHVQVHFTISSTDLLPDLSTTCASITWPLPQAPAICVPSGVQAILRTDPVLGFSKLYDHWQHKQTQHDTKQQWKVLQSLDWQSTYPCFITQSKCIERSNSKQFTIWRPWNWRYWIIMWLPGEQQTTIGIPHLEQTNSQVIDRQAMVVSTSWSDKCHMPSTHWIIVPK